MPVKPYSHEIPRRARTETFSEEEEEFRRALASIPPPNPPDGGWGWVVVFASFMINAIVDGVCYSFGIMLPEFSHHFGNNYTASKVDPATLNKLEHHTLSFVQLGQQFRYPTAVMSLGGALLLGVYMLSGQ